MKIFSLIQLQWEKFLNAAREGMSKSLATFNTNFNSNTIFGQLINVLGSTCQNILFYIEDSLTEQNKYTAERKRSIYNLAELSGYNPSMGKSTTAVIKLTWKPNNEDTTSVIIPNRTQLVSVQTGLPYLITLPQENIVCNLSIDNSSKFLTIIEGLYESQTFIAKGGQMYTKTIKFIGDIDIDYLEVEVDNEKWERVDSIYDMDSDGKQYVAKTSLKTGIDLIFGNNEHGRALTDGQTVKVNYVLHHGEMGNIDWDVDQEFVFNEPLTNINGEEVSGNEVFTIELMDKEFVNSGIYPDDVNLVREMIGMNSRALVLADAKNYMKLFKKFSFIGYSRVWTEQGSMVVNSLITKNYKSYLKSGLDYFNLTENDMKLSDYQKESIYNYISLSGEQLAGMVFNIFDPEIVKYACYVYVKLKDGDYDEDVVKKQIKTYIGDFFANVQSDIFVPKSDIVHLLKTNIESIDGVDVYFLSELNERALMNNYYDKKEYNYNPATGKYNIKTTQIFLLEGENPGVGLDAHGNIFLDNNEQFPVLMGGWQFKNGQSTNNVVTVTDPLTIIFE